MGRGLTEGSRPRPIPQRPLMESPTIRSRHQEGLGGWTRGSERRTTDRPGLTGKDLIGEALAGDCMYGAEGARPARTHKLLARSIASWGDQPSQAT